MLTRDINPKTPKPQNPMMIFSKAKEYLINKQRKKMGKEKGPSKKTEMKKKEKIAEDKTFGLKNKNKSAKVQK